MIATKPGEKPMLLKATQGARSGYKLTGTVRASDIFFWPGEPLSLDLSRTTKILGEAVDAILRASSQVVVEIIAPEASTGWSALEETSLLRHLREGEPGSGVYEVLP